jgi:predicted DNA-binding ribbon-helix-helix protein
MFTKHSIRIGGRSVSIRMEEEFWDCLRDIAADRNATLSVLVSEIAGKANGNADAQALASILRVYALEQIMRAAKSSSEPT